MTENHDATGIDVLIIGAGMAGLTAASALRESGLRTVVLDKGRGVGGRIASRRIGGATFDHGAQFITSHTARFAAAIEEWSREGLTEEWCRGFEEAADGHLRWRGRPAMTAIPKHLARDLDIRLEQTVTALRETRAGWEAETATGEILTARTALLTAPAPQSVAMLDKGAVSIPLEARMRLEAISYERCLAVMAVLEGPSQMPPPGGMQAPHRDIAWMADNQLKGISAEPAVTIHGTPDFSLTHWDADREESGRALIAASAEWLGAGVKSFQVHGWRYSKPIHVERNPVLIVRESPLLMVAGDAFGGPRVEGAALSGWAAAEAIRGVVSAG
jgi:renalase